MFLNNFFDDYWNFNNSKFNSLLRDSKRAKQKVSSWKQLNKNIEITFFQSVSKKELWQFINKLSIFINSWIDVKWALWILSKQTKNPLMKRITKEMKKNIDYWINISETMKQYPKVFDNLTVSLILVWEKTWKLWFILKNLDKTMIESLNIKWKVKWVMIYPVVLLFITTCMVTLMMVKVVPSIVSWYSEVWADLPKITQIVISMSDFFVASWPELIIWIIWIIFLFKLIWKTNIGNTTFAYLAINIPVFKFLVKQSNIVYFINSFTMLLNSWVLLLDSLNISSWVMTNVLYKKEIIRVKNEIESWLTMSKSLWLNTNYEDALYVNNYFPEDFAYIVNTWEETWTLSESLNKIWENYNSELKRFVENFATLLEPFIIVFIWWIVWTIILAIMLPLLNMANIAKQL